MEYNFSEIEAKWQKYWDETKIFQTKEEALKKFYLLVMFAYPSGDIHMGHFRNYSVADVYGRKKMMEGYDLLFPFGWDAFGLPAEGAAIKAGIDPEHWTLGNIAVSSNTLKLLGIAFDWSREIRTCMPDYYKWTQWVFLQLFKSGLAYRKTSLANWCPVCKTVLANEQVSGGECWRCHNQVEKKEMEQWFVRITDYSQQLLDGLDTLDGWPENIKTMQRNWIGRSEGTEIDFQIEGTDKKVTVFTTRPDTVFGVTFMAMAPEHPLAKELVIGTKYEKDVLDYIKKSQLKTDIDRTSTVREKDGVFTGRYVINPLSGEKAQLWIGDYVLASYGTGVVMGVPAHDTRDFAFAKKYDVPIKVVINPKDHELNPEEMTDAYTEEGIMVNSGEFNGLPSPEGIIKVSEAVEKLGVGKRTVNYKLRDWLVSRQRYWGAPVPIVHCEHCGLVPVDEKDLPVLLPKGDIDFIPKGRSPLADCEEFINTTCPKCGRPAKRDADTLDTFVCSSWYHIRYTDPHNDKMPFTKENADKWCPVDMYIGGSEHACMHLIYFRFVHKFLKDKGFLTSDEPALRLFNHGMVLDSKGEIMSKSKGNVVSPIKLMKEHGVDPTRLAMFFASPSEKEVLWSDAFIVGVKRFTSRFFSICSEKIKKNIGKIDFSKLTGEDNKFYVLIEKTVKKVSEDIDKFQYNTAISSLMAFLNSAEKYSGNDDLLSYALKKAIMLIAPLAPHMAEELWSIAGEKESIFKAPWPSYDKEAVASELITMVIQIKGKVRGKIEVSPDISEDEVKKLALEKVNISVDDVKKIIFVKGRLVNILV